MSKKIIVIGAGIAGLTSAFKLMKAGFDVTVLEATSHVGGAIRTEKKDGFQAELGPNTVLETSPKIGELIEATGLMEERIYANEEAQKRYIIRNKRPVELPSSPIAFMKSSLFSLGAKLRLFKEPLIPSWDNSYEESLAQFVYRRLGQEFLDYAINPFVAGVYAGDPKYLSVKHGFAKLYALEQKYGGLIKGQIKGAKERKQSGEESKQSAKMVSFKDGLSTLPKTIADLLGDRLHLETRVTRIVQEGDEWNVECLDEKGSKQFFHGELLIYAGNAHGLKDININDTAISEFSDLNEIQHPPVTTITLGFKREQVRHPLDGFGMLVPEVEHLNILGALFTSTLFPNRAPEDHVAITVFIGGARQPEIAQFDTEKVLDIAVKDLRQLLGIDGQPVFHRIKKWSKAIPQYNVGYGKYKKILEQLEDDYAQLYFTGNYLAGISVSDTIKHASELAERIIADA